MRLIPPFVAMVLSLLCASPAARDGPAPIFKRSIQLPDVAGRIDHIAYDPKTERLFVAALENGSLEVIDLKKGERIRSIKGLKEPQGVVVVPATNEVVVACGGDGTAHAFDAATLDEKRRVEIGDDADNIRLDADGKSIIIGHGDGAIAVLDAATLAKTAAVKLPGHPESFQLEPGTSRAFVNVPAAGEIVVADRSTQAVVSSWKLKDAAGNYPMALDPANKRLYIGCRRPAKLLAVDTASGSVIASAECVGDADEVFIDPKAGRVIVVGGGGGGAIEVFEMKEPGSLTKVASVKTASGARTGLLIAERRTMFIAAPQRGERSAEIREYALPD